MSLGSSGSAESARRRIESVLRAHGVAQASAPLAAVGTSLRLLSEREGAEFLATFDVTSGMSVGATLRGERGEVDARPHLLGLRGDRRGASIHTHLRSTPPSVADAIMLARTPALQAAVVVGLDGTWFVLSKGLNATPADHLDVALAFAAAVRVLKPRHLTHAASGAVTADRAERELLHEVWLLLAPLLGLRYDRIGSTEF